jgi:hypothetical protein
MKTSERTGAINRILAGDRCNATFAAAAALVVTSFVSVDLISIAQSQSLLLCVDPSRCSCLSLQAPLYCIVTYRHLGTGRAGTFD